MTDTKRIRSSMQVFVGIPTFRRPIGLKRLLDSVAKLQIATPTAVVVAENDERLKEGIQVVDNIIREGYPWNLRSILVPERGISQARNALMQTAFRESGADFLAMVDDDETVDQRWLHELLTQQAHTSADVVGGRIIPEFPDGRPRWVDNLTTYRFQQPKSGEVHLIDCTANVLMNARIYQELKQEFDISYSLSGGGDKEYFVRLARLGARFAYAPKAITFETFGKSRTTRSWVWRRAYRIGAGDMRIQLSHDRSLINRSKEIAKIPIATFVSLVSMMIFIMISQRKFMAASALLARQIGKISGIVGLSVNAYGTHHGK